jgi:hypothetical protein
MDSLQWLELFRLFIAVQSLYVSENLVPPVAAALQELTGGMAIEVLPALHNLSLEGLEPSGHVQEDIQSFVMARQLSGRPVIVVGPTLSEEYAIKAKRLQSILAARRSRKRKLEYQRELEDSIEAERKDMEMWRERALVLAALLRDKGHEVPRISNA